MNKHITTVHKFNKRAHFKDSVPIERPLYTWTDLQYIIPPPISDTFVNKDYFFLHYSYD